MVSEVERIAWSYFHALLSELHCPLTLEFFTHFVSLIEYVSLVSDSANN